MKIFLISLSLIFLVSCSVTHNHYIDDDNAYAKYEIVKHSYVDNSNHIVVIIKHRHHLNKHQKQRLKRWCNRHYGHHKKRIKCQFVLG